MKILIYAYIPFLHSLSITVQNCKILAWGLDAAEAVLQQHFCCCRLQQNTCMHSRSSTAAAEAVLHQSNYYGVPNSRRYQTVISQAIFMKFSASIASILGYNCVNFQNFTSTPSILHPSVSVVERCKKQVDVYVWVSSTLRYRSNFLHSHRTDAAEHFKSGLVKIGWKLDLWRIFKLQAP